MYISNPTIYIDKTWKYQRVNNICIDLKELIVILHRYSVHFTTTMSALFAELRALVDITYVDPINCHRQQRGSIYKWHVGIWWRWLEDCGVNDIVTSRMSGGLNWIPPAGRGFTSVARKFSSVSFKSTAKFSYSYHRIFWKFD